ncbi:MAG: NlpC/P60 family protein, partial [bacterium]
LTIPCNSTSQKCACTQLLTGADLKPADLIFFHDDTCKSINHVALYLGDGMMLESAIPTKEVIYFAQDAKKYGVDLKDCCVKKISVKERIGVDVKKIKNGKTRALDGRRIMLGSLLNSEEKIKKMRLLACGRDVSW